MQGSRGRWGLAAAVAALLVIGGCGTSGGAAPTVTETVTAPPVTVVSGSGGDDSMADATSQNGAPITVVNPQTTAPETGSSAAAEDPSTDQTGDAAATTETASITTSTAPTTLSKEAKAAARMVGTSCDAVLFNSDITKALGKAIDTTMLRVEDTANADNQMTARTKCYYGTDDLSVARPLVVAIASYADEAAAARQLELTLNSERAAGAKTSATDAKTGDNNIKIMVRDGGLAVTQVGSATVSVAIADGLIVNSALDSALTLLTRSALNHTA